MTFLSGKSNTPIRFGDWQDSTPSGFLTCRGQVMILLKILIFEDLSGFVKKRHDFEKKSPDFPDLLS